MRNKNLYKKTMAVFMAAVMLGTGLTGCGNEKKEHKEDKDEETVATVNDKEDIKDTEESNTNSELQDNVPKLDATEENQELIDKVEYVEIDKKIREAYPFSDGYAWIRFDKEKEWKCINEDGVIQFGIECKDATGFVNGYSVVDNSKVIDLQGEEIYDFGAKGYNLYDYKTLDVGCVILSREEGKVLPTYYSLDLETKKMTEIDLTTCAHFSADGNSGDDYKDNKEKEVRLCEYLGNGYYTYEVRDGFRDHGFSENYRMIQWYDVKNNKYVEIDSGIIYPDTAVPGVTLYFKTSNPKEWCVYATRDDKLLFIDIDTCTIKKVIDGYVECGGWYYNDINGNPKAHLIIYNQDGYNGQSLFLDINTAQSFEIKIPYEQYEILAYDGYYICISYVDSNGGNCVTVLDKEGNMMMKPMENYNKDDCYPIFWENEFVYYDGTKISFINTNTWKVDKELEISKEDAALIYEYGEFDRYFCLYDKSAKEYLYLDNKLEPLSVKEIKE